VLAAVCCAGSCPVHPAEGAALPAGGVGWGEGGVRTWSSTCVARLENEPRCLYEDNVVVLLEQIKNHFSLI